MRNLDNMCLVVLLRASWFNPVDGRYTSITGRIENRGTHRFTPPAKGDWVLLLQRHE